MPPSVCEMIRWEAVLSLVRNQTETETWSGLSMELLLIFTKSFEPSKLRALAYLPSLVHPDVDVGGEAILLRVPLLPF